MTQIVLISSKRVYEPCFTSSNLGGTCYTHLGRTTKFTGTFIGKKNNVL